MRIVVPYNFITYILVCCLAVVFDSCSAARSNKVVPQTKEVQIASEPSKLEEVSFSDLRPKLNITRDNHVIVKKNYDLDGKNLVLNEGYILDFQGGSFANACITGSNTEVVYREKPIFDQMTIRGTWIVQEVTTDMFKDLNYVQSLADVLALTNSQVQNRVVVKDYGYDYPVKVSSIDMFDAPLRLNSNTELQLDGNIRLMPTNLFQYVIMLVHGSHDVSIHGAGSIIGDKEKHDYSIDEQHKAWKSHEWGHGIRISKSNNVSLSGITVKDCTGDSYNIIGGSKTIILNRISAVGSRRQGVTIGVASDVTITHCRFLNIGKENGTPPGSAVDIEPDNTECEIRNIIIDSCEIKDCRQGIISWSYGYGNTWTEKVKGKNVEQKDMRHYVNVTVTNCQITGAEYAISLYGWDQAVVRGCKVTESKYFAKYPKNTVFEDNDIESDYLMINWARLSNCSIKGNRIKVKNQTAICLQKSNYIDNAIIGNTRVIVQQD